MSSKEKKKERRRQRYERNVKKELEYKKQAWENGKLIEENHNNKNYSEEYSKELGEKLLERLIKLSGESKGDNDLFILKFRLYREKIRDFILLYNPNIKTSVEYGILKSTIEVYWDEPENLLSKFIEFIS